MKATEKGRKVYIDKEDERLELSYISSSIIHCRYGKGELSAVRSIITDDRAGRIDESIDIALETNEDSAIVSGGIISAEVSGDDLHIKWSRTSDGSTLLQEGIKEFIRIPVMKYTTGDEAPVIDRVKTVDGERNFIDNLKSIEDHKAYRARIHFQWEQKEQIHGLGQGEEGIYGYRNHVQYLYQHNMRIPRPWILSERGYAMLFDCGSLMTFNDDERGSWMFLDTVSQLDYYFLAGECFDELIRGFRLLTGKAAMLPRTLALTEDPYLP